MTKAATNLVIVESPAKAQTIERYLGSDYTVLASYGHIRDLPQKTKKGSMAVDVENGFTPVYEIIEDKQKRLDDITRAAKKATSVCSRPTLTAKGRLFPGTLRSSSASAMSWTTSPSAGWCSTK